MVLGTIAGIVLGYFLFAKTGVGYISPLTILIPGQGLTDKLAGVIMNLAAVRLNILISGAIGAGTGLLVVLVLGKRR